MISVQQLKHEVQEHAQAMGVQPKEIHVRQMKTKWASCSTRGRITLDTGLLHQPEEFRREAIIHDLLHLRHPNHGKVFKALLKAHLG